MIDPQFLMVRFGQGSAGKFLLSLLMGSQSVAHFDCTVEANKTTDSLLNYIQHSFQDLDHWLVNEPNPVTAWNIHWISNKMERGSNQTVEDFNNQLKTDASQYFWDSVNQGKKILVISNKTNLPVAYQNLKPIVIISDQPSMPFVRKSIWYKHYGIKNKQIHLKVNDPMMYPEPTRSVMQQFDNPVYINESVKDFYRRTIWDNQTNQYFCNQKNFPKDNIFISLGEILNVEQLVPAIDRLCHSLGIELVNHSYIKQAHQHWIGLHTFRF